MGEKEAIIIDVSSSIPVSTIPPHRIPIEPVKLAALTSSDDTSSAAPSDSGGGEVVTPQGLKSFSIPVFHIHLPRKQMSEAKAPILFVRVYFLCPHRQGFV